MLKLAARALLLAVILLGSSLVFAEELMVTALVLVTIGLTTVALVRVPNTTLESSSGHVPHGPDDREASASVRPG